MKKGRGCNLAAGIIDIILGSFLIIGTIYYIYLFNILRGSDYSRLFKSILIASIVLCIILGVMYLVFGILTVKFCQAKPGIYYARSKALLAFSIVETIIICYYIFSIVSLFSVLTSISFLIYLSSMVLHWVGYGIMLKGVQNDVEMTANGVTVKPQTYEAPTAEIKTSNFNEDIYTQLTKLNELKQNGIITEEEFQTMKYKILNK